MQASPSLLPLCLSAAVELQGKHSLDAGNDARAKLVTQQIARITVKNETTSEGCRRAAGEGKHATGVVCEVVI